MPDIRRPGSSFWGMVRGEQRSRLIAVELGIGGAVRFEGRVSFGAVEAALSKAWALVAPSVWPEPLGLTAIEAITRGVPAIATATGGFAETVETVSVAT